MIATGGLLRINARRQDSLRSKPNKPHAHKRRNKKKRRNEVVVVKGKLKFCSVSGLVAALGILVLVVGVVMAALGYWPREGLFFSAPPQDGHALASVSFSSSPEPPDAQDDGHDSHQAEEERGAHGEDSLNWTLTANGTMPTSPRGFLQELLQRYLYSDRLKVFGPLIMGIGIFLFICANAVLHENRDKKTKVINLRDIYSTVIDLHSLHRPPPTSSSANPLNGLVNYVQSKSLEAKPRAYPPSLMSRAEGGPEGSRPRDQSPVSIRGGGAVFSICQDLSSHRLSLPPRFSPPPPPLQVVTLSSFTLPLCRARPPTLPRRHSAWEGGASAGGWDEVKHVKDGDGDSCPPPLGSSAPPTAGPSQELSSVVSCSSPSLSQTLMLLSCSSLTPSHLSLSSLSHLLSSSSPAPPPPCRRRSLPSGGGVTGYSKLMTKESFESTEMLPLCSERRERTESKAEFSDRDRPTKVCQENSG